MSTYTKLVKAYIQPFMFEKVLEALRELPIPGISIAKIEGFGHGTLRKRSTRPFAREFHPKIQLEILCGDDDVHHILSTICKTAQTGRNGDGLVFVQPIDQVVAIKDYGTASSPSS